MNGLLRALFSSSLFVLLSLACSAAPQIPTTWTDASGDGEKPDPTAAPDMGSVGSSNTDTSFMNWWRPAPGTTLQLQFEDLPLDTSFDVDVYDIDLFDTPASAVSELHSTGKKAICYMSAGSWEEWRPDAEDFPAAVLGNRYEGWRGERWLDIRQIDVLAPLIQARMDLCREKRFDGIEPDNIDGYLNETGFPISATDQLTYNRWLAIEAHARGLSIGLKNDPEQAADLLASFDWALTEDCLHQGWCEQTLPFIRAGKSVFTVEYSDVTSLEEICTEAGRLGLQVILKNRNLDRFRRSCP